MKELIIWLGLLSCPAVIFAVFGTNGMDAFDKSVTETPSQQMAEGRTAFERACAGCHGVTGGGTAQGPGLLAAKYGMSEMADDLIRSAVLNGLPPRTAAQPGMPAITHLGTRELDSILRFLREVQRANGIR